MGVIPKPDGGVRLIHDCSRPFGNAVNDFCTSDWHQRFAKVDDAAAFMTENCWFAKVDLKSAYRSVGISPRSQRVTGFKWNLDGNTVYLRDAKLPFGAKLSPGIFHRLTQAVKRMMARKGYDLLVVYLDDFLIVSQSRDQCAEALRCLIQLLRKLGFAIHWGKVVDPTRRLTFLGIELDSRSMQLRLPRQKLDAMKQELREFLLRKRATKRQMQSIAGRLSWAAGVVKGGRVFLRRIFNKIRTLKHGSHKALLTVDIRQDLIWWSNFLDVFNGRSMLLDKTPIDCVFTDACNDAAGGSYGSDWFYCNWGIDSPQAHSLHINEKEVLAVVLAANRWAPLWTNKRVVIYSDNSVTVASINKGTSRNAIVMQCLREFFWLSATYNFHLTARHIPGVQNFVADSASRLHMPGHLDRLMPYTAYTPLSCHMSIRSLNLLLDRFASWTNQQTQPYSTASYPNSYGCSTYGLVC